MRLLPPILLLSMLTVSHVAHAIELYLPVQCEPGVNCFIQKYVDHDTSDNYIDYRCGKLTNDGHKGTDFRVATKADINTEAGVPVLAAADGKVKAVRDGMPDKFVTEKIIKYIKGRECGNGVVIDHGDEWETQYCHMKKGSILVKKDQEILAGDPIGMIGTSGLTEYPHLHFDVRKDGEVIDPFIARPVQGHCGSSGATLWEQGLAEKLVYQSTGLLAAGFDAEEPAYDRILKGEQKHDHLSGEAETLYFWVYMFGLKPEHRIKMELKEPGGTVLATFRGSVDRHKADYMKFIGLRRKTEKWPAGEYIGKIKVTEIRRNEKEVDVESEAILVVE